MPDFGLTSGLAYRHDWTRTIGNAQYLYEKKQELIDKAREEEQRQFERKLMQERSDMERTKFFLDLVPEYELNTRDSQQYREYVKPKLTEIGAIMNAPGYANDPAKMGRLMELKGEVGSWDQLYPAKRRSTMYSDFLEDASKGELTDQQYEETKRQWDDYQAGTSEDFVYVRKEPFQIYSKVQDFVKDIEPSTVTVVDEKQGIISKVTTMKDKDLEQLSSDFYDLNQAKVDQEWAKLSPGTKSLYNNNQSKWVKSIIKRQLNIGSSEPFAKMDTKQEEDPSTMYKKYPYHPKSPIMQEILTRKSGTSNAVKSLLPISENKLNTKTVYFLEEGKDGNMHLNSNRTYTFAPDQTVNVDSENIREWTTLDDGITKMAKVPIWLPQAEAGQFEKVAGDDASYTESSKYGDKLLQVYVWVPLQSDDPSKASSYNSSSYNADYTEFPTSIDTNAAVQPASPSGQPGAKSSNAVPSPEAVLGTK